MKRIALVMFGLLLVMAMAAGAIEINSKFDTAVVANGAIGTFQWTSSSFTGLPGSFTIFSGDAAEFWITFYPDSTAESFPVHIPAGRSITMPMPKLWEDSGFYHTKFTVAGMTDSVFVFPWGQ